MLSDNLMVGALTPINGGNDHALRWLYGMQFMILTLSLIYVYTFAKNMF